MAPDHQTVRLQCRYTCTPQVSNPPILLHSILQPCPSLSYTAQANTDFGSASFVGGTASLRPNLSATQSCQNLIKTYPLVFLALWVRPCPACHHLQPAFFFFARHVMPLVGSGTLSRVPITVRGSISQNMLCVSSLRAAVGSSRLEHSFLVVPAILHSHRKHELRAAQEESGKSSENLSHTTLQSALRMHSTSTCSLALFLCRSCYACKNRILIHRLPHHCLLRVLLIH